MQNSMMMFTFFVFDQKYFFGANFAPKNQNYYFNLILGTYTNSNRQDSVVMFTFSVFECEYPFWANVVQKVKIISLS